MRLSSIAASIMLAASVAARSVLYIDEWHVTDLPSKDLTANITHGIMAFINPANFTQDPPQGDAPWEPVSTFRDRFNPNAKILIAVGGWGYCAGFRTAAATAESRALFARNLASYINDQGFDGIDIDWEYPGGHCSDYKTLKGYDSTPEIETFPLLLQEIRKAIGPTKVLSIAVPGLKRDMMAFTSETGPKIWSSVDFVNIMSYDLMNRRDNITRQHTSVTGSLRAVDDYLAIGLPPKKANLGFAFYAKWFRTADVCSSSQLPEGCPTVPLENPVDGSDTGKSGAYTFEKANMSPIPTNLTTSTDGTCGFTAQKACPSGYCCSQYGYCGNSTDFCSSTTCVSGYGKCDGPTIQDSWRKVSNPGKYDEANGAEWGYDSQQRIFWTWDTAEIISLKFKEIMMTRKLGGVMAWSGGEDSYDWSHLKAMNDGVAQMAPLWKNWGYCGGYHGRHARHRHQNW